MRHIISGFWGLVGTAAQVWLMFTTAHVQAAEKGSPTVVLDGSTLIPAGVVIAAIVALVSLTWKASGQMHDLTQALREAMSLARDATEMASTNKATIEQMLKRLDQIESRM